MTIFSERLKKVRTSKKMSQADVAHQLDMSKISISNYERGIRKPDMTILNKLANLYQVSTDWLLGNVGDIDKDVSLRSQHNIQYNPNWQRTREPGEKCVGKILTKTGSFQVPIILNITSSQSIFEQSNIGGFLYVDLNRLNLNSGDEVCVWQVTADNMKPTLNPGDFVLIKMQKRVKDGEPGCFIINDQPSINILYHANGYVIVTNTNPDYQTRKVNPSAIIPVGKILLSSRFF